MSAVVTCAECGYAWTVSREQIVAGGWQDCPNCAPDVPTEPAEPAVLRQRGEDDD